MNSSKSQAESRIEPLLPLFPEWKGEGAGKLRRYRRIDNPIWSHHKAQFIQQYLRYFVQVTKHGAYIDGFAGPQYLDKLDAWTASLVLASEPKWLRKFFLCELNDMSVKALENLVANQPIPMSRKGVRLPRKVEVIPGDFNLTIDQILSGVAITQKEATFCLLDQRTFECHWDTLIKLSKYKQPPHNKIELLYFLGVGWLHRAFSGLRNDDIAEKWWGRADWKTLTNMNCWDIAELVRIRFVDELGYRFPAAYPIYDRDEGNRIMYYMVHASDHDDAPALMVRAHGKAGRALPKEVQLTLPQLHPGIPES